MIEEIKKSNLDDERERLGELIRGYRKRKNIKLESAASFLMRPSGDLALIEQGLEPIKGNDFLNRNICKKYCAFIGIDDAEVSELIDIIYPISKPKKNQMNGSSKIEIKKERRKIKNRKKKKIAVVDFFQYAFVCVIIIVAGATLWLTASKSISQEPLEQEDTAQIKEEEVPVEKPVQVQEVKTVSTYKETDASGNYVYDVKLKDPAKGILEVSAELPCYVEIYDNETDEMIDGGRTLASETNPTDKKLSLELKGEKQLFINLGKTENAVISIDGEKMDLSKIQANGQNNIILNFS